MSGRRHTVLIGFREIAGFCRNLRAGLEEAGARADFVDLFADPRAYADGPPRGAIGAVTRIRARRASARGILARAWWTAADRVAMIGFFAWAMFRYDAFIFRSSSSFFRLRDLPLLRLLGKRVIFVYLGSDSRPSYLNGSELAPARRPTARGLSSTTAAKRRLLRRVERYATAIVSHAPSSQLHARPFASFLALGIPYPTTAGDSAPPTPKGSTVRALHAPSDPEGKGTARIREAIERLRGQGVAIELREISGQPNAEVLHALTECDFVIDQAYSDTPMATFGAEAAALGRAAVVGGYGWDDLRRATPAEALPPAQLSHPEDLEQAIRQMCLDLDYRDKLGTAAHRFVRSRWSPVEVARRYLALIEGSNPTAWMVDPLSITMAHGAGLSRDRASAAVWGIVDELGPDGLCLDHNPEALAAVLALPRGSPDQAPMVSRSRSVT